VRYHTGDNSQLGIFKVKVTSTAKSAGNIEVKKDFEFLIYLHESACIDSVITKTSLSNMSDYIVKYGPQAEMTYAKFTESINPCGAIKYTVKMAVPNANAQALIGVDGSTNSSLTSSATQMSFQDSAAFIKLTFGTSTDLTLVGTYVFTIEATLADYPEMDSILRVSDTF
jgi:hypothetical protein